MIEYTIAIFLAIVGFICVDNKRIQRNKGYWIASTWLFLTLLIGFRFQVGGDTISYMNDYNWQTGLENWDFNLKDKFQPGYTLLCSLAKSISSEFYVFQLLHAAIVNTLLFIFINKYTRFFFASLLSVFFTCYLYLTTEILRETIAVLIFVLNYKSLLQGKWVRYYLGILLCCTFHLSAIFLIVLPFLCKIKINKYFLLLLIITFVAMVFLKNILNTLSQFTLLADKLNSYKELTSTGLLADILNLFRSCIFPLCYCLVAKFICKQDVKFENMIAIMSLLGVAAFFSPIIFNRATNYFILFYSISIADFCVQSLRQYKIAIRRYALALTLCFFISYSSGYIMYGRYQRWVPYYSIFNPKSVDQDNYGDNK